VQPVRLLLVLIALGAWAIVPPYLGPPLGLELDVAASTEVVDHVVPGVAVIVAGLVVLVYVRSGRGGLADLVPMAALGLAFLAGFWITATHVPLIGEAARGESPWDAAVWHNTAGLPIVLVAGWLLVGPLFRADPEPSG
jgi:hypothetical protein